MRLIPTKESIDTEFKSDKKGLPDAVLVDAVVAMANSEGGSIYLGVEDDGTITGVKKEHQDKDGVCALIANKTVPSIAVRAELLEEDGNTVLKIEVPKSRSIVSSSEGKILKRRLKADGMPEAKPLYPYEIQSRLSELKLLDFSAQPLEGSSLEDFDPVEQHHLRDIIRQNSGGDKSLLELSDTELNQALHLITDNNGKTVPTVSGMLILGRADRIEKFMPTAKTAFQVLQGTEVRINEISSKPLLKQFDEIESFFKAWNPEQEIQDGLFRIPVPEFSPRAFREAVVNAFSHRDYTQMGLTRILIDDEGLSVSNPGGFVEGVNFKNLISSEPNGRNPNLSDILKRIGLAERTGRGIDRIYEGSIIYGRQWPDYSESTASNVKVFIPRSAPDLRFAKMIREEQEKRKNPFSIYALMILSIIRTEKRASLNRFEDEIGLSQSRAKSSIEMMVESGLVEGHESGKTRFYTLSRRVYRETNEEANYVRLTDIDKVRWPEMIVKFAKSRNGIINKSDVMELLKINAGQAYSEIKKLVKDGTLIQVNKGKYAKYRLNEN